MLKCDKFRKFRLVSHFKTHLEAAQSPIEAKKTAAKPKRRKTKS